MRVFKQDGYFCKRCDYPIMSVTWKLKHSSISEIENCVGCGYESRIKAKIKTAKAYLSYEKMLQRKRRGR